MAKKVRMGVFGFGRGYHLAHSIIASGAEVVAICEKNENQHKPGEDSPFKDAVWYTDFDEFIKHDMDAVLLANYFTDHTEYAIKCMEAGKHVLSETISNITMAQGVRLVRAKERTGMIYCLLENYPYFKENLEMKRVYETGEMGRLVFAEGEYVHPMDPKTYNTLSPERTHWRNWTPRTYYTTHALAPLMFMTGAMPTKVTAMASFRPEICKDTALRFGDAAAVILCQTDTDPVFRVIGWSHFAPHGNHYRLCCTDGGIEVSPTNGKMRLTFHDFTRPEKYEQDSTEYDATWPDADLGEIANQFGHGGGDFLSVYYFVKAIETGTEPYWDVYRATRAASVAILAWRSILNNNMTYDVPDFRKEEDRLKYENDNISPYPPKEPENGVDGVYDVDIPCSSKPYNPPELWLENHDRDCRGEELVPNDLEKQFIK